MASSPRVSPFCSTGPYGAPSPKPPPGGRVPPIFRAPSSVGGSACSISGRVLGTDLVVEVARWRFADRRAPEVLAVPSHGLLALLSIGAPAHYHLPPVLGHSRALVVVHAGAYLDGFTCP